MKKTLTIFAVSSFVLAQSASAALVYSNNFDGETVGSVGAVGADVVGFGDVGGTGADMDVVASGTGFASKHLQITSRSDNGNYGFAFFDGSAVPATSYGAVTTYKFDVYMDATAFNNGQIRLRSRDVTGLAGTDDVSRWDLNAGDLAADTVHTIRYVVNNSASTADVPDGTASQTIDSGKWAVYVGNNAANSFGGNNFTAVDGNGMDYLTMWVRGDTGADTQGTALVDNFEIHSIPEPATLGLVVAFSTGILFIRRMFMM